MTGSSDLTETNKTTKTKLKPNIDPGVTDFIYAFYLFENSAKLKENYHKFLYIFTILYINYFYELHPQSTTNFFKGS